MNDKLLDCKIKFKISAKLTTKCVRSSIVADVLLAQSEVSHLDVSVLIKQNIFKLYVAINYAF